MIFQSFNFLLLKQRSGGEFITWKTLKEIVYYKSPILAVRKDGRSNENE
jgi:hypothetical protein